MTAHFTECLLGAQKYKGSQCYVMEAWPPQEEGTVVDIQRNNKASAAQDACWVSHGFQVVTSRPEPI